MTRDHVASVHVFQQFFLCACGAAGRQEGVSLAVGGSNRSQLAVGRAVKVSRLQAEQQGSVGQLQAGQQKSVSYRQSSNSRRLAAGEAATVED